MPGAGPVKDGMHIPIIVYANDDSLMAVNGYEQIQELLKALQLFGFLFDMEVNLIKTKMMIFSAGSKLPESLADICFISVAFLCHHMWRRKSIWAV